MMGHITSLHKDEENKTRVALATRPTAQGSSSDSSLCPRCSGIFLDPNACQSLIETDRQSPYRIDHYTISELKKYADHGCPLCSVLSRASQRDDDENMGSFFEICPIPATGLRSEIVWTVGRNNRYGQPVHWLSFYFFAVPGKL
jgi:Zn-finger nucleic acid-binding protein